MKRVYLDSCTIIYLVESETPFNEIAKQAIARLREGGSEELLVTSQLARIECRVKPMRDEQPDMVQMYDHFFAKPGLLVYEISPSVIERATVLRASHGFKVPDAIHLATALETGCRSFLTGDTSLGSIPDLEIEILGR